jgi:hypothetical protein
MPARSSLAAAGNSEVRLRLATVHPSLSLARPPAQGDAHDRLHDGDAGDGMPLMEGEGAPTVPISTTVTGDQPHHSGELDRMRNGSGAADSASARGFTALGSPSRIRRLHGGGSCSGCCIACL